MGYVLEAIATDLTKVAAAVGSKDKKVVTAIVKIFGDSFDQFDEMADEAAEMDDLESVTMKTALTQIVMGQPYCEGMGFMYGYAIDFICKHFGDCLPNDHWSALPNGSWIATVDKALKAAGIPKDLFTVTNHLQYRGSPVPIPAIDDFPGMGYLTNAELKVIRTSLDKGTFEKIKDGQVIASIQQIQSWISTCLKGKHDLFCTYA